jgi:hypothetical protein
MEQKASLGGAIYISVNLQSGRSFPIATGMGPGCIQRLAVSKIEIYIRSI